MIPAPVILAMDTSLGGCSVAVASGGGILVQLVAGSSGQQSRLLVPMIEDVLTQAGVGYKELTAVATTLGPGGFTGIRVGLSTARAIALAAGLPLIGLTTLEVMAAQTKYAGDNVAVIDAYRGQYYFQRFAEGGTARSDAVLVEEKDIAALAEGAHVTRAAFNAADVALLAAAKWARGERVFPVAPLYIREPDAKLPANAGLKYGGESV